jgi:glycosyltransferase involved in cell wall biosynthesis
VGCGRLTPQKGFADLIDAFTRVRAVLPASLWIVGEGEERGRLERQIRRLGLTDSVRLLGFRRNPYQYLAAADVFALSSRYEGFGNVVVEAMACNTPVVATDCPYGPAEIISDGLNGVLTPPADAEALSQAIIRVLKDPSLQRRLAERGRIRSQDFTAPKIADVYGDLLWRVANEGRAAAFKFA